MHQRKDDFQTAGVEVLVVTPSRQEVALSMKLPYPVLCDPDRNAYRAFGFERGSWRMFFRWRVLAHYLRLIVSGWWPRRNERDEDVLLLGGDVLIGKDHRLMTVYRSHDPADRPSAQELLDHFQQSN